jgi:hypothetical protein
MRKRFLGLIYILRHHALSAYYLATEQVPALAPAYQSITNRHGQTPF